jgi:hypothetical protein
MSLDKYHREIESLVNQSCTQIEIRQFLINKYGRMIGFSERSIRSFIKTHNLLNKVNDDELVQVVGEAVQNVGPTSGRSMMKGVLKGLRFNACASCVRNASQRGLSQSRHPTTSASCALSNFE